MTRLGALIVAGLLACLQPAAADTTTLNGTNAPIVRVNLREGDVTIRTWDRPIVQVDGESSLTIIRRFREQNGQPDVLLIPRAGPTAGADAIDLPAENFVPGPIPAGPRETIVVNDQDVADLNAPSPGVVVTVPSDAVFVFARAAHGNLDVRDYRGGTLVTFTGAGRQSLGAVGGIVFAQSGHGPIVVTDSSVDRIRARSVSGNITFERCRVRQIEATTGAGSIVYDDGAFEAGIARFESVRGNVAVGSDGPVDFAAHAAAQGHVFTDLGHGARIQGPSDDEEASVGDGGPVVTATTQTGRVFLYQGSLHRKTSLRGEWREPLGTLQRPAATAHHGLPPEPARLDRPLPNRLDRPAPTRLEHPAPPRRFHRTTSLPLRFAAPRVAGVARFAEPRAPRFAHRAP